MSFFLWTIEWNNLRMQKHSWTSFILAIKKCDHFKEKINLSLHFQSVWVFYMCCESTQLTCSLGRFSGIGLVIWNVVYEVPYSPETETPLKLRGTFLPPVNMKLREVPSFWCIFENIVYKEEDIPSTMTKIGFDFLSILCG